MDFERSNFSLSQATFIENAEQKLIPILPKNDTSRNITIIPQDPPKSSHNLSGGVIAGIVVAIVVILLIGATVFIIRRRRAQSAKNTNGEEPEGWNDKPELDGQTKPFVGELYHPHGEADSSSTNLEMDATTQPKRAEIQGSHGGVEMEGSRGGAEMFGGIAAVELEASILRPVELPSPNPGSSAVSSPRIGPHTSSPSLAAEERPLQSPSAKSPEPPLPWPSSSLSPSSRSRPNLPPPSSDAETENPGESGNPDGRKRRWVSIGRRWRGNEETR